MNLQHSNIPFSKDCDEKEDKLLLEPYTYLLQAKGKNIRKKMLTAFNKWLNIPTDKLNKIIEIIQILHNASLLLDDIEDNGILRRGIPTSHKIYGEPRTINCANYAMFIALERVIELNHPLASKIFSEQLIELHRGQGMEIYWRDSYQCPTEEEYRKMSIRKTGGLFALGVRLMQLFSESKSNYLELVDLLGLYFQVRDDYAGLVMSEYHFSKGFAEDLTEGKFSFLFVHAIKTNEEDNQIINILRKRTTEDSIKKHCIHLLEQCGSFEYTKNVLKDLDSKARTEVHRLGGNPLLDALLDELMNWDNK
ncbi:terpene synthase [Lepeophtheirus salmonis]|uniref:terpene synthase n=1 Tax=Lepeophtheirus salmonis TaxID=72036 RepID=UPI001AE6D213|nr:geranylgeranyl pyrophosphate synthase-like [Lepeophtheirus salmonis]